MASNAEVIAIWMDRSIGEEGAFEKLKAQFRTVSSAISRWIFVDSDDRLYDAVTKYPVDQIILIMSGSSAKRTLGSISSKAHIHSVYLFCARKEKYATMVDEEEKIRAVCDTEDDLYDTLQKNLNQEFSS